MVLGVIEEMRQFLFYASFLLRFALLDCPAYFQLIA
jgi:hypothetical protein